MSSALETIVHVQFRLSRSLCIASILLLRDRHTAPVSYSLVTNPMIIRPDSHLHCYVSFRWLNRTHERKEAETAHSSYILRVLAELLGRATDYHSIPFSRIVRLSQCTSTKALRALYNII